ncbi:aaa family ATPase [Sclerotinia borealis F-4128]|uniref:Aaa family ATPase n=1 Tax=Sclerotinia borealis (strain F-4128) TaxID=1432307 RepID=W9C858_SCLBF|nr:aaa family ATPase [Sclerotinia borealis F-4128]
MSTTEATNVSEVQVAEEDPSYLLDPSRTGKNHISREEGGTIREPHIRILRKRRRKGKLSRPASTRSTDMDNGKQPDDVNQESLDVIECYIRYRDINGMIKIEPRDPSLAIGSDDSHAKRSTTWLTLTENANDKTNAGLESNPWTISIADQEVLNLLKETLKDYIEHTGKRKWDNKVVRLPEVWNPIVINWRRILEKQSSLPAETDERLRRRFNILLDMHQKIHPSLVRFQASRDTYTTIRFTDLGGLIIPGSLVVTNWLNLEFREAHEAPQVFKVSQLHYGSPTGPFMFTAWLWDWNGRSLVRTMYTFTIPPFDDYWAILRLPIYPVDFFVHGGKQGIDAIRSHEQYTTHKDGQAIFNRRRLFRKYTIDHRRAGPVLRYCGDIIKLQQLDKKPVLVKIDEEIVLDTENYVRRTGSRFLAEIPQSLSQICHCSLCEDDTTTSWRRAMMKDCPLEDNVNDLLLAPRVFGYALTRKTWCQFALDKIVVQDFSTNTGDEIYEKLVLPENMTKDELGDIQQLVTKHSLILLFHGHSGTGKTIFAESLAKASSKALFKVGMSDIGLDNLGTAERRLKEIFELATTWNVVLLMREKLQKYLKIGLMIYIRDEADFLLDARGDMNEGTLVKNALVSMLLREVEYFKGILIMTTNRVTAFDPAILSRIHHAVNFTQFTAAQKNEIWQLWLTELEKHGLCSDSHAIKQWVNKKKPKNLGQPLNGREIRNIFICAQTFAFERTGKDNKVSLEDIERATSYKYDFRRDTEAQRAKADVMHANR